MKINVRQSNEWAEFMKKIGWEIETLQIETGKLNISIKKIPILGSAIKIHRPNLPIPLDKIDQIAKKYRALFVKIQPNIPKETGDKLIKQLEDSGYGKDTWPLIPTKTIQIDLTNDQETLLAEISKDARYSIRRAKRNGIKVEVINCKPQNVTKKKLDNFFTLLKRRGKAKDFQVQKRKEFEARINAFGEKVFLVSGYRSPKEDLLAGALIFLHDEIGYYLQAASSDLGRKLFTSYLVMWEAIKLTKQKSCLIFDLMGIYDPRYKTFSRWKDFTTFKRKFGGKEITYVGAFIKYYNKLFKSLSQYAP